MRPTNKIFYLCIAVIFLMMATHSCTKEHIPNEVHLTADSVAFDNTGQFLSIVSELDWEIQTYSPSSAETPDSWFTVTPSTGSGSSKTIALSYKANTTSSSRKVSIAVIFPNETITVIFTQGGKSGSGGGGSSFVGKWMEIPVVDTTSTKMFVSHHTSISNKTVRNYSMLFDQENRIALWVAYPLCAMYIGSQGRTNNWVPDPNIPENAQPAVPGGYAGVGLSGYDRGHQIPSADRTAAYEMNAQTFYYANQTPQNSSLNQGIWAKLEGNVRGYSSTCDTLYVVTGCVIKTKENQNISFFTDYSGNQCAIPKAYFKVLMKYTKSSSKYQTIGFWYENKPYGYSEPSISEVQTVKWIEEQTGYSFFENLPSDVASSIKNEFKPSEWGF